jgi:hypothetical protein
VEAGGTSGEAKHTMVESRRRSTLQQGSATRIKFQVVRFFLAFLSSFLVSALSHPSSDRNLRQYATWPEQFHEVVRGV